jgi:dTDP-4-dehydrorhamnose reductase
VGAPLHDSATKGEDQVRIVITGAAGMLGSALARALRPGHDVVAAVGRSPLPADLAGVEAVPWTLPEPAPAGLADGGADVVVHCAALTSVDAAERDPDAARRVNVEGTRRAAELAARCGAALVYVSTDSVFDGARGDYAEDDAPGPLNVYARTKLEGEVEARRSPRALVLRTNVVAPGAGLTRWVLDTARAGGAVPLFRDVRFNPVPVDAFAPLVLALLSAGATGTVHVGSRERLSKAQFGRLVLAYGGLAGHPVSESRLADAPLAAPRPLDTTLSTRRARALGVEMPSLDPFFRSLTASPGPS